MAGLKITRDPAVFSFLLTEDLYPIKEIFPREENSPQTIPQEASPRTAPEEASPRAADEAAPRTARKTQPLPGAQPGPASAPLPKTVPTLAEQRDMPPPPLPAAAPPKAANPAQEDKVFHYLGENRRFILILVNYPEEKYLPEAEKAYLAKILSAVKLDLEDVALLNYAHYPGSKYAELKDFFAFNSLLLFGVGPNLLQIPGPVLPYHLGLVEGVKILAADSTEVFRPDAGKKKSLWEELKKVFS